MNKDDVAGLIREARLDAKAFRENTVYDGEGDAIRLIANAERLDQYADALTTLSAENERLREALGLADAALRGANMNMNVVERKLRAELVARHD